jgi:hypothetical protein
MTSPLASLEWVFFFFVFEKIVFIFFIFFLALLKIISSPEKKNYIKKI